MELKKVNTHWREGWSGGGGFTTGQEAVITTAEALYAHTERPRCRRGKIQTSNQRTRGKQTLHSDRSTFTKARAQLCVIQPTPTSSGAMPHIFTSEIEPTYKYGNLVRAVLALDRGRPKLTVKRSNICTDKPLKTM